VTKPFAPPTLNVGGAIFIAFQFLIIKPCWKDAGKSGPLLIQFD
jgi:hypothetical protein